MRLTRVLAPSCGWARRLSTAPSRVTESMSDGSMYNWRVQAVLEALAKAGKAEGPLDVDDLSKLGHLDQYHYLGTEACDDVAELLGLVPESTLLDVGSGIGGPARYLAATTGCTVVGIEYQNELSEAATSLTARVPGLADRVAFVQGDACDARSLRLPAPMAPHDNFDHFMSLLVNLHVPDRHALHSACFSRLAPGGTFVIEDFAALAPPTAEESRTLVDLVKAPSVTSVAEYVAELQSVGFVDLHVHDMSPVWTQWTAARSDEYAASEADAVALHGRAIFDDRRLFYRGVADLFAKGNIGGVRITGRRPTEREATLLAARDRLGGKYRAGRGNDPAVRILESGATFTHAVGVNGAPTPSTAPPVAPRVASLDHGVSATQASAAQLLDARSSAQPALPWLSEPLPGLHDSLQYHFFFENLFLAVRIFHTESLQSTTAWAYDFSRAADGPVELLNTYTPLTPQRGPPSLHLEGEEISIVDAAADGIRITLRPTSAAALEMLERGGAPRGVSGRPELTIEAAQGHAYGWMPAGFETAADRPVIHRPQMTARASWCGVEQSGHGYSKRYHGAYPRQNQWRFIHGVATTAAAANVEPPSIVWTADATFGDDKYNYFKLLPPAGHATGALLESASSETYQQQDAAYAVIGGQKVEARLDEIAKWHTIIGGRASGEMESKYENRLCKFTLRVGDEPHASGVAYNERCLGTLW